MEKIKIIRPQVHRDNRGEFFEKWKYDGHLWVQENQSRSVWGVIRGLHGQRPPFEQAKLVHCVWGKIRDVWVNPETGHAEYVDLSGEMQVYIPRGYLHGFAVLSEWAIVQYKVDNYYSPEHEWGLRWDSVGVDWGVSAPKLSEKDLSLPLNVL